VVVAVAQAKNIAAPAGFDKVEASAEAKQIATSLLSGEPKAILLGNSVMHHPQAAKLHAAAQWIAQNTDAKFGFLTEAANTIGGYLAKALPGANGANAAQMFEQGRKAYLLLNAEPEFDTFNPQVARAALNKAEMVVVMSPFKHGMDYADVLLPVSPFSETSGTFINCEGRAQSFNGSVKPLVDTRPAWKVLRVLGNLLELQGFDYDTSEAIRNEILGSNTPAEANLTARLSNFSKAAPQLATVADGGLERVADVGIYWSDAIVRRSQPLQQTKDGAEPKARLSRELAQKLGIAAGDTVKVSQGEGSALLVAAIDETLPANVVRVAAGHQSTSALGAMFGSISVEKA
jgi:NADH-quinone oxidoreductase subunit G